jgi:hypothetical protein
VDGVVIFDEQTPAAVLEKLQPAIFAKGGDHSLNGLPEARIMERWAARSSCCRTSTAARRPDSCERSGTWRRATGGTRSSSTRRRTRTAARGRRPSADEATRPRAARRRAARTRTPRFATPGRPFRTPAPGRATVPRGVVAQSRALYAGFQALIPPVEDGRRAGAGHLPAL